jgi:hypothetical protein
MEARRLVLDKPFDGARDKLEEMIARLGSAETLVMSHSEVEALVDREGREILRRLLQAYFDLRGQAHPVEPVVGSDGVRRNHVRARRIPLKTSVGKVFIRRAAYSARGVGSLCPVDAALNLPRSIYSFGVQKRVAHEASRGSFDEVVEAMRLNTNTMVPKRQAEMVVQQAAADFDAFYRARQARRRAAPRADSLLVITTDGKGIAMRKEDLREVTRRAAETKQNKLSTRLSKGEQRYRKRMAAVASVYSIERFRRRPEDVLSELRDEHGARLPRPRAEQKRVWASIVDPPEVVIEQAFEEASSRDRKQQIQWVGLVDGNKLQLQILRKLAKRYGIKLTIILDVIHVLEYVWTAAWAFHEEGSPDAEIWVRRRFLEILRGKSSAVAAGIRRSATRRRLAGAKRRLVDRCARYLLKHREFMRYDRFLANGLPIATGVIEGACRHLVQDRMARTGARWSLAGAEAVLRLRALMASDFEEYWGCHESRELDRNHRSLYSDRRLPRLREVRAAPLRLVI